MLEKSYISLVPGPVQVHQRVLDALSQQVVTHLHEGWAAFYNGVCDKMRKIFLTKGEVFVMASSGTGGIEAAISSTLEPGEKLLVLVNGFFGQRLEMVTKGYNYGLETLNFPTTGAVDPQALRGRLQKGADVAAVAVVHSESQNGILNPIQELAKVCHEFDVPLIVDCVSSLAGTEFRMDEWGIDIAVSSTQKCIGSVVGLTMVAVRDEAWKYIENKKGTCFYFSLNEWRESMHHNTIHPHPCSMSETMVFALNAACDLVLEEGLENRWARHWGMYDFYTESLEKLGFSMFVPRQIASPNVISIDKYPSIEIADFQRRIKLEYGILIGVGIHQQHGKIWRIGNMAEQATEEKARKLLEAIQGIIAT